jgi:hypothetical protein
LAGSPCSQTRRASKMARACIAKGATGGDAELLGELLKERGHLNERDYWDAQDVFDVNIYTALRAFQAANGLEVDGIAGPNTWKALGETGAACSSGGSRSSSSGALVPAGGAALPLVQRKWFLPVIAGTVGIGILALLFWPKGKK